MTPSGQHPITAARAPDLPGRQPGLDADRIDSTVTIGASEHYRAAPRKPAKT